MNPTTKKDRFIAAYGETGTITAAADLAGIHRSTHYDWLKTDAAYAGRFEAAKEEAAERLEAEARRRAVEGVLEPTG